MFFFQFYNQFSDVRLSVHYNMYSDKFLYTNLRETKLRLSVKICIISAFLENDVKSSAYIQILTMFFSLSQKNWRYSSLILDLNGEFAFS